MHMPKEPPFAPNFEIALFCIDAQRDESLEL